MSNTRPSDVTHTTGGGYGRPTEGDGEGSTRSSRGSSREWLEQTLVRQGALSRPIPPRPRSPTSPADAGSRGQGRQVPHRVAGVLRHPARRGDTAGGAAF